MQDSERWIHESRMQYDWHHQGGELVRQLVRHVNGLCISSDWAMAFAIVCEMPDFIAARRNIPQAIIRSHLKPYLQKMLYQRLLENKCDTPREAAALLVDLAEAAPGVLQLYTPHNALKSEQVRRFVQRARARGGNPEPTGPYRVEGVDDGDNEGRIGVFVDAIDQIFEEQYDVDAKAITTLLKELLPKLLQDMDRGNAPFTMAMVLACETIKNASRSASDPFEVKYMALLRDHTRQFDLQYVKHEIADYVLLKNIAHLATEQYAHAGRKKKAIIKPVVDAMYPIEKPTYPPVPPPDASRKRRSMDEEEQERLLHSVPAMSAMGDGEVKEAEFTFVDNSGKYKKHAGVVTDNGDGTFTVRVLPPKGMNADEHVYDGQVGGVQILGKGNIYHTATPSDRGAVDSTLFGVNVLRCNARAITGTSNVQYVFGTSNTANASVKLIFKDAYPGKLAIFRERKVDDKAGKADGGAKKRRIAPPAAAAPSLVTEDFESELARLRAALRHDIKHVEKGFPANAAEKAQPPSDQNTHNLIAMLQALALLHTGAVRGDRGGLDGVVQIMPRKYVVPPRDSTATKPPPKRDGTVTQAQLVNIIKGINGGDPKQKGSGIPERSPTGQLGSMDLLRKQVEPIYWGN